MLEITDSGANMQLGRQANPKMDPVIMENDMKAKLLDGSTMDSTHIATIQLIVLSNQARQSHVSQKCRQPH